MGNGVTAAFNKQRRVSMVVSLAMVLSACGGGTLDSDDDEEEKESPFIVLAQGNSGIQTVAHYVVKDSGTWNNLWAQHVTRFPSSPPVQPVVDFSTHMVVGTFVGSRSNTCYSLELVRVLQSSGRTTVQYRENVPAAGAACGAAITDLFFLAKVPVSSAPVEFEKLN